MGNSSKADTTVTILGCGTSTGVPLIQCKCRVCRSTDPKNKRLRASVWFQTAGKSILVDTSTDLRQQALREKISRIDAVLYTHPHADHMGGIDELRSYNFLQNQTLPAYGNGWTCSELRERFPYIFHPAPAEGGGKPQVKLHLIPKGARQIRVKGVSVRPVPAEHGSKETLGYVINSVGYMPDLNRLNAPSLDRLRGLKVLILDCLRYAPHPTHLNLEQALELIEELKPEKSYLTHMGHDFDYRTVRKKLPKRVFLAYDGLKIRIPGEQK